MKQQDCTNCRWAEWKLTKAGRRALNGCGECKYEEIILPNSYQSLYGDLPQKSSIHRSTGIDCKCWEKLPLAKIKGSTHKGC